MVTYEDAIQAFMNTMEGVSTLSEVNNEYLRGEVNLLAELFPVVGQFTSDRMQDIANDISNRMGQVVNIA